MLVYLRLQFSLSSCRATSSSRFKDLSRQSNVSRDDDEDEEDEKECEEDEKDDDEEHDLIVVSVIFLK